VDQAPEAVVVLPQTGLIVLVAMVSEAGAVVVVFQELPQVVAAVVDHMVAAVEVVAI
jgi:hypothetical protein